MPRPFKLGWNIHIKGKELPLTAILGLLTTTGIWIVVLVSQPFSRWAGFAWMAGGLVIFLVYHFYQRYKEKSNKFKIYNG